MEKKLQTMKRHAGNYPCLCIAGKIWDVLNTSHESYEYIPIRSSYILQLHRKLVDRYIKTKTGVGQSTKQGEVEKKNEAKAVL